jgi:signal transduction histidine kinase
MQHTVSNGNVVIRLQKSQNKAIIVVQDWGAGIAESELSHLFYRFHRVESDRNRHSGGAGLGLAIAQAITQAHGGQISVQSQVGKGSTFTVQLPIRRYSSSA